MPSSPIVPQLDRRPLESRLSDLRLQLEAFSSALR